MKRHHSMLCVLLTTYICLAVQLPTAHAAIVATGGVYPSNPDDWNNSTDGYVGRIFDGTLTVNSGSDLTSQRGYIGFSSGVSGAITVDGVGSTWTNTMKLFVGFNGSGTLNISNSGAVSVEGATYVNGSLGTIVFGPDDGSLSTRSLYVSPTQLSGIGTIDVRGLVSDVDLVFDASHGLSQTFTFADSADQNVTINLEMSNSSIVGDLGAGYQGNASLSITDGISVCSASGCLGYSSGSAGRATIDGANSTWTTDSSLCVGRKGNGTLKITNGGSVFSNDGFVSGISFDGVINDNIGTATVDGDNSKWVNDNYLYIGFEGIGTLNIINNGTVTSQNGILGVDSGSKGVVNVDGHNSTWTCNGTLSVGNGSGSGVLNITGGGTVSNSYGSIGSYSAATGTVTVSGANSKWTTGNALTVGDSGSGTLNVSCGGTIISWEGYVGFSSSSNGVVAIDGADSTWACDQILFVGYSGNGSLDITGGAAVSSSSGRIGHDSGSSGVVTVDGADSMWTNNSGLYIGDSGSGILNINGGGAVSATSVSINSQSLLAIDVGYNSSLSIGGGSGKIDNDGTVRILAGAGATAGNVYSPISAATWSGSGFYQAVGGTWNETMHEFTVSDVLSGTSDTQLTINLASTQRALIADDGDGHTGWSLGASFRHKTGDDTTLLLTATAIDTLDGLELLLGSGESVLGAWNIELDGDGYTSGDPAYLSFDIGAGYSRNDLQVWHFDGTDWSEFDAMDLTYNGDYASFTVTGFSGYAVSAVPEPGTLLLLIAAVAGLTAYAQGKR